jgi:WbqC-like protein family
VPEALIAMAGPDKSVAIVQSNYIPWKGYFDLIGLADEFILLDDVQYTTRDWRNRNRVKTKHGLKWLTIPVADAGRRRIDEVYIADPGWASLHWETLLHSYSRAPHFRRYAARVEEWYANALQRRRLSAINRHFIEEICKLLEIDTPITSSTDYGVSGSSTSRLVALCRAAGATRYLSGPKARAYLDEAVFDAEGVEVVWMSYEGYPEYPQLHAPFEHGVTVLDMIFNVGPDARAYMKTPIAAESRS